MRERENGEKDRKTERETETKRSSFDERGASVRSRCGEKKLKLSSSTFCLFLLSNFFLLLLPSLIEKLRGRLRIKWILYVENSLSFFLSFFLPLSLSLSLSHSLSHTLFNRARDIHEPALYTCLPL